LDRASVQRQRQQQGSNNRAHGLTSSFEGINPLRSMPVPSGTLVAEQVLRALAVGLQIGPAREAAWATAVVGSGRRVQVRGVAASPYLRAKYATSASSATVWGELLDLVVSSAMDSQLDAHANVTTSPPTPRRLSISRAPVP
jgi:hypothetical protein